MRSPLRSLVITAATLSLVFGSSLPVFAQEQAPPDKTGLTEAARNAGYTVNLGCEGNAGGCIPQVIGNVVNALLGIFGALFLALLIWGGAQYMLSSGNEEKVKAAKATLTNAIIGMLIVAASYAIATFVLNAVGDATSGATGGASTTPAP